MIGMIGVIILVAREIIPMTRMIAQIYKNTKEKKENTSAAFGRAPKGAAGSADAHKSSLLSIQGSVGCMISRHIEIPQVPRLVGPTVYCHIFKILIHVR